MEQIIFTIRPSMKPIAALYILTLLVLVFFALLALEFKFTIFLLMGFLFPVAPAVIHMDRQFTIYTLTDENIRIRVGVIGKTQVMIPLEKVQNISFSYSLIQRIFGTGNLLIESASQQGAIPFKNIDKPEEFSKQILEELKNYSKSISQP
jgi:uncharacterized membrane protein YdbT with pleckstrin-like domain